MSRTYRRKNSTEEWRITCPYERLEDGTYIDLPPTKYDIAKFYSDTNRVLYPGYGSCGKWRKKIFARGMRFKNKEILDLAVREYNDEPMFIPYYHPYR